MSHRSKNTPILQALCELIDNKVNNGQYTISYDEIDSLTGMTPKKRYSLIYNWYRRGTSLLASFMNQGHKWKGAFNESHRLGYRFLKPVWDPKRKNGFYFIINTEHKHDDYETSNEKMLEMKLTNKYTLTESMKIETERRFVQMRLDELFAQFRKKKKKEKKEVELA